MLPLCVVGIASALALTLALTMASVAAEYCCYLGCEGVDQPSKLHVCACVCVCVCACVSCPSLHDAVFAIVLDTCPNTVSVSPLTSFAYHWAT